MIGLLLEAVDQLGGGLGLPSVRVSVRVRVRDDEQLTAVLASAIAEPGPHLIEAAVPGIVG